LAWVLVHQDVSTAILGISKLSQLEENLKALEVSLRWTPEVERRISELLNNEPEMDINYRNWEE
jgi:aryl-alcohol dehydrogenase-like predicted oxidoreductase